MPSTITAEKAALRKSVKEVSFTDEERSQSDRLLLERFLALPQVGASASLLLYYGVGSEPDTAQLLEPLLALGKEVFLPRCLSGGRLEARLYRGRDHLLSNRFGIPEPDEACPAVKLDSLSLVLVPGLCFDRRGYRLGHGGGYYDRLLAGQAPFTVALCRERLLLDALPTEPHDRPVDLVLTERECLSLRGAGKSGAVPRFPM